MATKSATEMWGPARKSWSFRNLSSSSCRHLSSSARVFASVSGGTRWPRNMGNIIWQAERGLSVCLGPGLVPALVLLTGHPVHFSSLLSTPSHPRPPPAQASSLTHAWPTSTSPWVLTSGSQGIPLQSQSACSFSLHKAFHGSLLPPPHKGLNAEQQPSSPTLPPPPTPPGL